MLQLEKIHATELENELIISNLNTTNSIIKNQNSSNELILNKNIDISNKNNDNHSILSIAENHLIFKELKEYFYSLDSNSKIQNDFSNKVNILNMISINTIYLWIGSLSVYNQNYGLMILLTSLGFFANINITKLSKIEKIKNFWSNFLVKEYWNKKEIEQQVSSKKSSIKDILNKDETKSFFIKLYNYFHKDDKDNSAKSIEQKREFQERNLITRRIKENLTNIFDFYINKETQISDSFVSNLKNLEQDLLTYISKTVKFNEFLKEFENIPVNFDSSTNLLDSKHKDIDSFISSYEFKKKNIYEI